MCAYTRPSTGLALTLYVQYIRRTLHWFRSPILLSSAESVQCLGDLSPSPPLAARKSPAKSPARESTPQLEDDTAETIAVLQAEIAERDKQLQEQIHSNTASTQLEGLKLPTSDHQPSLPSLEAATFDQLIKVYPRPEKFSGTSKNVSTYDWLKIMED